jgi:hypothetical protein
MNWYRSGVAYRFANEISITEGSQGRPEGIWHEPKTGLAGREIEDYLVK